MPQFVVLLRGVNVGKANRVPMAAFRALLQAEGFSEVRTLLNSGNAIFRTSSRSAASHAKAIHARLRGEMGISVPVVVLSASELRSAIAECPLAVPEADHPRLLVAFAQEPSAVQGLAALLHKLGPGERMEFGPHAAYLFCAGGILESKLASAMVGKLGGAVTSRNWATVLKLQALLSSGVT